MGARTNAALERFVEETGGMEGPDIFFVQFASGFSPEPVTPKHLAKRSPYSNPEAFGRQLEESAGRGWLEPVGEGKYALTARGKKVVDNLWVLGDELFGGLEPLPVADLERVEELLQKVANQARQLPEPKKKIALKTAANYDRGPSVPTMVRARRRLLDVRSFRDDAHIAAWQPFGAPGHVWEAFTYVWRGDAGTAAELTEALPYRNFDEEVYASALAKLAHLGWIAEEGEKYVATAKGKKLRQEAEDATDRIFDTAWVALDAAETKELKELLGRMAEALKPPEEDTTE
jgi:hypothetical protein